MRESISYTFILNVVILFIFVCFAIIMGIFSYYRAFRANTIIVETIEKYEGYNCISEEEIARKLNTISYNTPFNVTCNSEDGTCTTDNSNNYKVIAYELDINNGNHLTKRSYYNTKESSFDADTEKLNSTYICENIDGERWCATNKHYQYGVYTYMYVDLPVVSQLLKLSYFSKTNVMYEFRNFYVGYHENKVVAGNDYFLETSTSFPNTIDYEYFYSDSQKKDLLYVKEKDDIYMGSCQINNSDKLECEVQTDNKGILANRVLETYAKNSTGVKQDVWEYEFDQVTPAFNKNYRLLAILMNLDQDEPIASYGSTILNRGVSRHTCGYIRNYNF